jgi:hypothetical protein
MAKRQRSAGIPRLLSGTYLASAESPVNVSPHTNEPEGTALGIVRSAISDFDETSAYYLGILAHPGGLLYTWRNYYLYLRMDDTAPDASQDGVRIFFDGRQTTTSVSIDAYAIVAVGGVDTTYTLGSVTHAKPAFDIYCECKVEGDTLTVSLGGTELSPLDISSHGTASGKRWGVGVNVGGARVDFVSFTYVPTTADSPSQVWTLAGVNGALYRSDAGNQTMTQVSGNSTISSSNLLSGVEHLESFYIADYEKDANTTITDGAITGDQLTSATISDWTVVADADDDLVVIESGSVPGTYSISSVASGVVTLAVSPGNDTGITLRVVRGPKKYDSTNNTISMWTAAKAGTIPTECPIIARYNGRIILAGAKKDPHIWYQSAQNDPEDWDYTALGDTKAVAGSSTAVGVIGQPITALIPYRDDYLIYGCSSEMWVQRGDLRVGGDISNLSRTIGVLTKTSWCWTPKGQLVWLSKDGVYGLLPGGVGEPQPISRNRMPRELLDIDAETTTVHLAWDRFWRGVNIFLTVDGTQTTHWWLDIDRGAFWPESYRAAHQPTAVIYDAQASQNENTVLVGCYDGYVREYSKSSADDDGQAFASSIVYGPIRLGRNDLEGGVVEALVATLARGSEDVEWSLYVANTGEEVVPPNYGGLEAIRYDTSDNTRITSSGDTRVTTGTRAVTGDWSENMSYFSHPMRRGGSFILEIRNKSEPSAAWAMEGLQVRIADGGLLKL